MKVKFLPAYEKESSITIRLNRKDAAIFLAKHSLDQLEELNTQLKIEMIPNGDTHTKTALDILGDNNL